MFRLVGPGVRKANSAGCIAVFNPQLLLNGFDMVYEVQKKTETVFWMLNYVINLCVMN